MSESTSGVTIAEARAVINRLMQLLGGPNGQKWLDTVLGVLNGVPDWARNTQPLLYTVEIGIYGSCEGVLAAIKGGHGRQITDSARNALSDVGYSKDPQRLSLAIIPGFALCGERRRATWEEISKAIHERGGQLCPQEAAPALWAQHAPQGPEKVYIAAKPVPRLLSGDKLFYLKPNGQTWDLRDTPDHRDNTYSPKSLWVYLVPTDPPPS